MFEILNLEKKIIKLFVILFEFSQIFNKEQQMELSELIKLAEKDPETACSSFSEKFDIDHVTYFDQFYNTDPNLGYKLNNQHLCIEHFELMQNFVRYFGQYIRELRVICAHHVSFEWTELANLICTHCTTLKILNLFNCIESEDPLENVVRKAKRMRNISRNPLRISKAIATLESLKIENIFIDSSINLSDFFPNLRTLDLIIVGVSDPSFIEQNLSKLEHLGITLVNEKSFLLSSDNEDTDSDYSEKSTLETIDEESNTDDKKDSEKSVAKLNKVQFDASADKASEIANQFNHTNIKNAIALNPQLQSLHLGMKMDIEFINFINETLSNLQKIKFLFGQDDFMDHSLKDDIIFKCVTSASLGVLGIISPPITFQQLEKLDFVTDAPQSIIYYIKRHSQLKNLHLICQYSDDQAYKIVKCLANLKDLYLIIENNIEWTARGLIRFLAECERLQTVMLMVRVNASDQQNWRALVEQNNMWEIDVGYEKNVFTIEKIEIDEP